MRFFRFSRLSSLQGAFWLSALTVFAAMRLSDLLNAFTGLWVIPQGLPGETLGAVLPLMQFGAVLALPVNVLTTVFTRHLCAYAASGDNLRACGLLRDALTGALVALALALGVAAALMPWLCASLRVPTSPAGYLAVGYGLLAAFAPMAAAALQAMKRFGALAAGTLVAAPVRLAAMLLLLPLLGLSGYFVGQIVPLLATIGVSLWALRPLLAGSGRCPFAVWRADARPMFRYAGLFALGAGVAALQAMAATFVVRHRLSDDASAAYYLISRFAEIATYCGSTLTLVLFPYAVEARARGEKSSGLRDGMLAAILVGGVLLAAALWVGLPWLFARLPGYASYVPYAPYAAYLALTVTLNAVSAGHFAHAAACDDFRYLRYAVPCAAAACAALLILSDATLLRVLNVLFATAALQALCVAVEILFAHRGGWGSRRKSLALSDEIG